MASFQKKQFWHLSFASLIYFAGYSKSIDEFTYQDSIINDVVLDCMSNISLTGVSGNIVFGEGADPIRNVRIEQIQGRREKLS